MLTQYDAIMTIATVRASGANSFFASPASKSTGSSTAIVVSVDANTGKRDYARAGDYAASKGESPSR